MDSTPTVEIAVGGGWYRFEVAEEQIELEGTEYCFGCRGLVAEHLECTGTKHGHTFVWSEHFGLRGPCEFVFGKALCDEGEFANADGTPTEVGTVLALWLEGIDCEGMHYER